MPNKTFYVAVMQTEVYGVIGYYAKCLSCNWTSKGTSNEKIAAKWAKQHGEGHAKREAK